MTKMHYNYVFKLSRNFIPCDKLNRYIFKDNNILYVTSYEKENNTYIVRIWNSNFIEKKEYEEVFEIPSLDILEINKMDDAYFNNERY